MKVGVRFWRKRSHDHKWVSLPPSEIVRVDDIFQADDLINEVRRVCKSFQNRVYYERRKERDE